MPPPTDAAVRAALSTIIDPLTGKNVLEAGLVSGLALRDGKAGFLLTIEPHQAAIRGPLRLACEQAVAAVPGVTQVTAVLTSEATPGLPSPQGAPPSRAPAPWNLTAVPNVLRCIAVASGKGGVGKSTLATGLALAFAAQGRATGLLDADILGPSLPRMMGLSGKPAMDAQQRLIPPVAHGVQCLSMGLLIDNEAAVMRGPMLGRMVQQMLRGAAWGQQDAPLDTLFLDLPPGTGDVQLSLVQAVPLAYGGGGAVLVTTPQEVALEDARKAAQMFVKVGVPILGVIENMSWFDDPAGQRHALFGTGGGQRLAEEFGAPLLGQLPLLPPLREQADAGRIDPTPFHALASQLAALMANR